ncbi:hypothetical protein [Actinoallomurus sp. CA-142502]|uniref:hypothetical protein n=1 Tax=Actinoallomurus sp. CA-142502 TaxID=3239885 RepID=UPI003D93AA1C
MAHLPVSGERGYAGLRPNPLTPEDQVRLRELAERFGIPERTADLLTMAQNGILIRPPADGEETSLERTRTAGPLSLPAGFRWPHVHWDRIDDHPDMDDLVPLGALVCQCDWSTGFPLEREEHGRLVHRDRLPSLLHHIIQLDLAELAPYDINGLLPRTGLLQVFAGRTTDAAGVGIGHVEYLPDGNDPALVPFDLRDRADPAVSAACEWRRSWPNEYGHRPAALTAQCLSTLPMYVGPVLAGGRPDEDWFDDDEDLDDEDLDGEDRLGGRDWPGDEHGAGLSARLGGREHGTGFVGGEFRLLGHPQDFDKEFYGGYPWHGLDPTMPRGAQMLVGWVDPGTDSPAYVYVDDGALARGDFSQVTVEFTQQ